MKALRADAESVDKKYRAYIGCTEEAIRTAEAIQDNLDQWCFPELSKQGFFSASETTIESLESGLPEFDFAVFLLTPDDASRIRGKGYSIPRDNLLLEVGLAIGILGRARTFLVVPEKAGLRLPSDVLGVTYVEYTAEAPNPNSAVAPACRRIRDAVERQPALRPVGLLSKHFRKAIQLIHPHYLGELNLLMERLSDLAFSKRVIRRNWTVDLSYDFTKIVQNIITEKMLWDYEFVNIGLDAVDYHMTFFMLKSDLNRVVSFTKLDAQNTRVPVFTPGDAHIDDRGFFQKQEQALHLEPGVPHYLTLQFLLDHPVSPDAHYIHNSLASIQPAMSARIKAVIPEGYSIDVLGRDVVSPTVFGDIWDFRIPGPLLPEQIIEYIFRKKGAQCA